MRVRKKRTNKNLVICPRSKQWTDLVVCAASCERRLKCDIYKQHITIDDLLAFIEQHPEYELKGEIMAAGKTTAAKTEKKFWVIYPDKTYQEVTEKEIINNPQEYVDKEIWDKPPFKYEVVISLKKVKA